jgi:hypothetical protein
MKEIRILGTRIHNISLNETISKIKDTISNGKDLWIITANPELIFRAEKDFRLQSLSKRPISWSLMESGWFGQPDNWASFFKSGLQGLI